MGVLCATSEKSALLKKRKKLEDVAIANALQLEAARRRAGPIPFSTSPMASLKSLSLSVAVLERIYCSYVTLCCDLVLWPRDLDLWPLNWTFIVYCLWLDETLCEIWAKSDNPRRSIAVWTLTLWPWTLITCTTMLCDSLQKFKLSQAIRSWNATILSR